jgi:predicted DNA-binding protein (MmcQ/YjbR family)
MPDLESIRTLCLSLPDTTEDMPWDDNLCFKIRGKIFTGVALSDGRFPRLTLKVPAEAFHDLLEIDGISIAPYVGRYNWIALANSNVVPAEELEALIRQSYELVEAKAPKAKPPGKKSARKKKPKKNPRTRPKKRSTK